MKDKFFKVVVALLVISVIIMGCSAQGNNCNQDTVPAPIAIQMSPNWTYIRLNLKGAVEENVATIGNAVLQWEQQNPDREIVSVTLIYEPETAYAHGDIVNGLSIYSKLK